MHRYRVRPGYGSTNLLVELIDDSSNEELVTALRAVLIANGIKSKSKEDLIFSHLTVMESVVGVFNVEHDEWNMIWLHAEDNQDAIIFLDSILTQSTQFQKEEVDFNEYALPRQAGND